MSSCRLDDELTSGCPAGVRESKNSRTHNIFFVGRYFMCRRSGRWCVLSVTFHKSVISSGRAVDTSCEPHDHVSICRGSGRLCSCLVGETSNHAVGIFSAPPRTSAVCLDEPVATYHLEAESTKTHLKTRRGRMPPSPRS